MAKPARKLRVLITSGGTTEPVDGVRVLTNTSTGSTGALIADTLARAGHDVVLLRSQSSVQPEESCDQETFLSFADLEAVLEKRFRGESFDAVIHAAAVSDFSVEAIEAGGTSFKPGEGKIPSGAAAILKLRKNPKLLDSLRKHSRNPAVRVVAFKLTRGATAASAASAVKAILSTGAADFVVHNDLARRGRDGAFPAEIWRANGTIAERCADRASLATALERLLVAAP
jgi:phosphopantothenoylcysteine synthetase/decarboxylase